MYWRTKIRQAIEEGGSRAVMVRKTRVKVCCAELIRFETLTFVSLIKIMTLQFYFYRARVWLHLTVNDKVCFSFNHGIANFVQISR